MDSDFSTFVVTPRPPRLHHLVMADVRIHEVRSNLDDDDDDSDSSTDSDSSDDSDSSSESDRRYYERRQHMLSLARSGRASDLIQILKRNPDLTQAMDTAGDTALHVAARFGHADTVKQLVQFMGENRADVRLLKQKNNEGDTPLHLALKAQSKDMAAYLISKKPEVGYELNYEGISPLFLMVEGSFQGLVEDLFSRLPPGTGLSMEKREKLVGFGKTSVAHAAFKTRNKKIFRKLFSNLPKLIESKNEKGWKPISYAACKGYYAEVRYLLKKFPNCAKVCDEDGSFPIHKAVIGGDLNIVAEFLLRYPESMYQKDRKHRTILHIAARYDKAEEVLLYLKNNHNNQLQMILNSRDVNGCTYNG